MPRNYFACHCGWSMPWAYMPRVKGESPDTDIGLIIAQHVEKLHPETIYGDNVPVSVFQKWRKP